MWRERGREGERERGREGENTKRGGIRMVPEFIKPAS